MKVVIVAPYLASRGGAARFTLELSEYLAEKNNQVILTSLYTDRNLYQEKNNLKIVDIGNKNSLTQTISFWLNLNKIRKKLRELVNEENPDLVLFMNFPATLLVQKFGKIPIVCYPHDINLLYTNTYIKNLSHGKYLIWVILRQFIRIIDKRRWRNFDEIICNSDFSAQNISKTYNVKTKVIYPGTDTNVFRPIKKEKKRVVLIIAAQRAQRADFLIKSIKNLLKNENDFKLWVVGSSGEHHKELRKLVENTKLTDKVKFFGKISDTKLIELYSQSLAVIHLVRQPPFGLTVTESMACGTPVIACHPGGTDEIVIHNDTGFLINEKDQIALNMYIKKFLDKQELSYEMGEKGRERIKEFFELKTTNEKFRQLMNKLISS